MTLEPIPGTPGDFYDPDQLTTSSPTTPQLPPQDQQDEEQPAIVAGAVLPEGASQETVVQATTAAATPAAPPQKEDPTDFEHCDIEIRILLQRADGDPRGRLVSVLIHNFSGTPVTQDFREADLTDKARLDSIQRAIYPPMQRFLMDLTERRRKKLEDEAKRASRTVPPAANKLPTPASPTPAPQPAVPPAAPSQAAPASTAQTTTTGKKEESASEKQGKYKAIPLF